MFEECRLISVDHDRKWQYVSGPVSKPAGGLNAPFVGLYDPVLTVSYRQNEPRICPHQCWIPSVYAMPKQDRFADLPTDTRFLREGSSRAASSFSGQRWISLLTICEQAWHPQQIRVPHKAKHTCRLGWIISRIEIDLADLIPQLWKMVWASRWYRRCSLLFRYCFLDEWNHYDSCS